MLNIEGLQSLRKMAAAFDDELKQSIKADSTISNGDRLMLLVDGKSNPEVHDKVRQIKENYIKDVLPKDFSSLLPTIKYSNQGEEKTFSCLDIVDALNINNPEHINFPSNSKNYSIEYKIPRTNDLGMPIPEVTLVDKESNQKWVISCGLGHIDWLKALNVETERTQEQFDVVNYILAKRNGALKIGCENGKLSYTGQIQGENQKTHEAETMEVTTDNLDGVLSIVSNKYLMKMMQMVKGNEIVNED